MTGRHLTEYLSSNTLHAGFTDDAVLVVSDWLSASVILIIRQLRLLREKIEIDSIRTDFTYPYSLK